MGDLGNNAACLELGAIDLCKVRSIGKTQRITKDLQFNVKGQILHITIEIDNFFSEIHIEKYKQ